MPDEHPPPGRPILLSVAASQAPAAALSRAGEGLVVRVQDAGDLSILGDLDPDRVAWVEVPLDLADRPELDAFSVDVQLSDPQAQAGRLYRLARLRDPARPRLTLPTAAGFGDAAAVAMALHFPVRIVPVQPDPDAVRELEGVLERYLHDSGATEPLEPFHSALAVLLHGAEATLWDAVERDPAWFRREPPDPGLEAPDAVEARWEGLVAGGAQCASCPLASWCAGWFKWPDPAYDCTAVRRLFARLAEAADQLRTDLADAREALP